MTTSSDAGWQRVRIGVERALGQRTPDGVVFLFGEGPPRGGSGLEARLENLRTALGPAVRALSWCRQVHGVEVRTAADGGGPQGACDGLLTAEPGTALLVQTADCVPVLAAGRRVVAAVHAGWRGTAGGIIQRLLASCLAAGEEPAELRVALGPAVASDHYPVGPEVIAALAARGVDPAAWRHGRHVDLRAFLAAELHGLGVRAVEIVGRCTACDPDLASFRRDGAAAGRQLSLVYRGGQRAQGGLTATDDR